MTSLRARTTYGRAVWIVVLTTLATLGGLVWWPLPANAHPYLIETLPQAGRAVDTPPREVGLVFDERVSIGPQAIVVDGQARGIVATTEPEQSPARGGQKVAVRPKQPLPDGRYAVRWQVVGEDGHAVTGSFGFGVGTAASTSAAEGSTSTPGLPTAAVLRWLIFAGLALALGGLVGDRLARARLASAPADPPLVAPRPWMVSGCLAGAVGTLGLGIHQMGGGSLLAGLRQFDLATLVGSQPGRLILWELGAFLLAAGVAAAVAATVAAGSWRQRGPVGAAVVVPLRVALLIALLAALAAEAGRNHLFVEAGTAGGLLVGVHLLAAAIWVGALLHVARTAFGWRGAAGQARALFVSYAYLALVLYLVVVATGTVGAIVLVPSFEALVDTAYGQTLLVKLALVLEASALALVARQRLLSPVRLGDGLRIVHLVRVERATLAVVLAVTAVLASMPTAAPESEAVAYPPPVRGAVLRLGAMAGQVNIGVVVASRHLEVQLEVPESDPGTDQSYRLRASRIGTQGKPTEGRASLDMRSCGQGCFFGTPNWHQGTNTVRMSVEAPGWHARTVRFEIPWPIRERPELLRRALDRMATAQRIVIDEVVTSDTSRPAPPAGRQRLGGKELLQLEPYKSGRVGTVAELDRQGRNTWIAFGLQSQQVYVRMLVTPDGRVLREVISSPRHLIRHRLTYPTAGDT